MDGWKPSRKKVRIYYYVDCNGFDSCFSFSPTECKDVVTVSSLSNSDCEQHWIRTLDLYPSDWVCLNTYQWLTDAIINAGQKLLKLTYPRIGGLQSTLLGKTLAYEIQTGQFIQILHAPSHWTTVSNIGCDPGHINILDSILSVDITSQNKQQLAALVHTQDDQVVLEFQPAQLQRGINDRGLFALAYAASLCSGEDPTVVSYIQHRFRKHLLHCFEEKIMTPFPKRTRQKKKLPLRSSRTFSIYCICRLPESGRMIMCDSCHEWFHSVCSTSPCMPKWTVIMFQYFIQEGAFDKYILLVPSKFIPLFLSLK